MQTKPIRGMLATTVVGAIFGAILGLFTPAPTGCLDICLGGPQLYAVVFGVLGAMFGLVEGAFLACLNARGWCQTFIGSAVAGGGWLMFSYVFVAWVSNDSGGDLLQYALGTFGAGIVLGVVYGLAAKVLPMPRLSVTVSR